MSLIQAIIVNYNGAADTIECLSSLKEQEGVTCRPLVVDNASTDNSVASIRAAHPDTEIITTEANLGFAGGNNVGIRHTLGQQGFDYLFLLNNDTVMEPDCLKQLVASAQARPNAGILTPAIYWYDDRRRPWFTGSKLDEDRGTADHILTDLRDQAVLVPFDIPWSTGCAMLISTQMMARVGGFDERFFCYWEDVDLSLRVRAAGSCCLLCPSAVLYHKVSATSKRRADAEIEIQYYSLRNRLLCFAKNTPWRKRVLTLCRCTSDGWCMRGRCLKTGSNYDRMKGIACSKALLDFYRRRFGRSHYRWMSY